MDADYDKRIEELKSKIKSYPDFPIKGILFWDIFSAISDGETCGLLQGILVDTVRSKFPGIEVIVGLESRGFLFAFSLAAELRVGCMPVRKKGKLPGEVVSHKYDLEYGSDILEIKKDAIRPGAKCLIIDDLIATGGSLSAAVGLLKSSAVDIIGCLVVMEIVGLSGRKNIPQDILDVYPKGADHTTTECEVECQLVGLSDLKELLIQFRVPYLPSKGKKKPL